MGERLLRLTKEQWDGIPDARKGRIGSAVRRRGVRMRQYRLHGREASDLVADEAMVGRRTLLAGRRMLVEGLGFVVIGDMPGSDAPSLV